VTYFRSVRMPCSVRAFVIEDSDGDYNVYVNSNLSPEAQERAIQHELKHISNGDTHSEWNAQHIENELTKK